MKPVLVTEAALADIRQSMTWYESLQSGLEVRLKDDIMRSLMRIERHPKSDTFLSKYQMRRQLTSTFPYAIYYSEEADRIMVIAILHQRMDVDASLKNRGS